MQSATPVQRIARVSHLWGDAFCSFLIAWENREHRRVKKVAKKAMGLNSGRIRRAEEAEGALIIAENGHLLGRWA